MSYGMHDYLVDKALQRQGMRKSASTKNMYDGIGGEPATLDGVADGIGTIASTALLPGVGLTSMSSLPLISHLVEDGNSKEGLDKATPLSLIPGVGGYRNERRHMYVDNKLSKGKNIHKSRLAEKIGVITSLLPLTLLGGLVGGLTGGGEARERFKRILTGMGAGLGVSLLPSSIAGITGLLKDRRTDEEHRKYLDDGPVLSQYFIPGVAAYNNARRRKMMRSLVG